MEGRREGEVGGREKGRYNRGWRGEGGEGEG